MGLMPLRSIFGVVMGGDVRLLVRNVSNMAKVAIPLNTTACLDVDGRSGPLSPALRIRTLLSL